MENAKTVKCAHCQREFIGRMPHRCNTGFRKRNHIWEDISETKTQAIRHNNGKLRWSLVDFESLEDMVKVLEFGANKYSDHNWKKGLPTTQVCESLMRHLFAYLSGEDIDPESGLSHVGHIQCNAMFLSYMQKNKIEFDDRHKK